MYFDKLIRPGTIRAIGFSDFPKIRKFPGTIGEFSDSDFRKIRFFTKNPIGFVKSDLPFLIGFRIFVMIDWEP